MTTEKSTQSQLIIAFEGSRRIGRGPLPELALTVKQVIDRGDLEPVLIFDGVTSQPIELDLRGSREDVTRRLAGQPAPTDDDPATETPIAQRRGPGRPKLGVVSREVTLLPRHWTWLSEQPGSASVTLRKLVEQARRADAKKVGSRQAQESAYRFMSSIAGNEPGFEEATRALFAGDAKRFAEQIAPWPADVREHSQHLADLFFDAAPREED